MDDLQQSPVTPTSSPIYQESTGGKNAKWLWLLIAIIIIASLGFAFYKGIGPFAQFRQGGQETSQESSLSESFFSSPSPSPSPEATGGAALDKAVVNIRILNGNGKVGVASAAKNFIEGKGYKVTSLGNAQNYDFAQTVIKLKESLAKYKDILISDLSDEYSVSVSDEALEATDSADVEITIGAK